MRGGSVRHDRKWIYGLAGGRTRRAGMIENSRTGERIVFEVRTPELLVMRSSWTRPGRRAAAHLHPVMEERYDVLAGQAAFRIGSIERTAVAGETVVVPPGTPHLAWNPTDGIVELRITMRPALRWARSRACGSGTLRAPGCCPRLRSSGPAGRRRCSG